MLLAVIAVSLAFAVVSISAAFGGDVEPLLRASADLVAGEPVFDDPRFLYPLA